MQSMSLNSENNKNAGFSLLLTILKLLSTFLRIFLSRKTKGYRKIHSLWKSSTKRSVSDHALQVLESLFEKYAEEMFAEKEN
jgi:hypothetical protein